MKQVFLSALLVFVVSSVFSQSPGAHFLWQIGKPDNGVGDLAGSPDKASSFRRDGVFIVGRSKEKLDWPFAHPGPDDAWAGERQHSFYILFGIKDVPASDSCRLQVRLLDTHESARDRLSITVNGKEFKKTLPNGSGQAIYGNIAAGHPYAFTVAFPANLLNTGDNNITITSTAGSWFIYDWLGLETPADISLQPVHSSISISGIKSLPFIVKGANNALFQSGELSVLNTGAAGTLSVKVGNMPAQPVPITTGSQQLDIHMPIVTKDSSVVVKVEKDGKRIAAKTVALSPVTLKTVYVLPHSHNDIGYTEIQTAVEKKQLDNLLKGIEYSRKTKDYPKDSRFVWNLEGTYVADLFLQRMSEKQKHDFLDALKDGGVALNGMYLNTLTGLCRPEELLRLFKFSTTLEKLTGIKVDAAMISDVPGYTWGTVAAMAQAGIKYFSAAPNYFDRIGDILPAWENKPFYWVSPSGKEKLLVWIPYKGYALSHGIPHPTQSFVTNYTEVLKQAHYPYEISYIRWSGHGDNAVPDLEISEFVKEWNRKFVAPHFIISSTSRAFKAFEDAYGDKLPRVQGDWTGYWEDGAASSALETSENRTTSSRLSQAEALWSITNPNAYPAKDFNDAWHNVLLYSEHTWGADISVTTPLAQKTIEQWEIKKSYADKAHAQSKTLLSNALTPDAGANAIDIFNTNSWTRTSLVLVPADLSIAGDAIKDAQGTTITTQRLSTGQLAFIAKDIPPYAAKRYFISKAKTTPVPNTILTTGNTLDNGIIRVTIDPTSGAISSIRTSATTNNFIDSANGNYANDYLFLHGSNLADLQRNGQVKITIKEQGPVLSTLLIESTAPGCNKLTREVTLAAGFDHVEMTNILDKQRAELNPNPGDYAWANTGGKECVNFGFPFHVSNGQVNIDIPFSIMQPEKDQIPGSCKNWLEVGRWADVSNDELGITWVTLDAPLVEVGGITATLLGGQSNPDVWRKKIEPTQKLYSWAINNHWETNYRAYQEGIITFRYALRPHAKYQPSDAARFAQSLTQPLIVTKGLDKDYTRPLLTLSSDDIVVEALKPSEDGKAYIITLFNPSAHNTQTTLQWSSPTGAAHYSNTAEQQLSPVQGSIAIAARDVITVRVERP